MINKPPRLHREAYLSLHEVIGCFDSRRIRPFFLATYRLSFGGSEMFPNQILRFVNRNDKQSACGDSAGSNCNPDDIKANLFCRTSAERVRNLWGTSAEGKPENDRIKKQ